MDYGGAANIQSSNVTLCDNVVFQINIGHYGGVIICYKQFVIFNNDTLNKFRRHTTAILMYCYLNNIYIGPLLLVTI